jgi:hypothetical protein
MVLKFYNELLQTEEIRVELTVSESLLGMYQLGGDEKYTQNFRWKPMSEDATWNKSGRTLSGKK